MSGPGSESKDTDESSVIDAAEESSGPLGDLARRVDFVKGIDSGLNTDVDAVFDLVLQRLTATQTTPAEVKRMAVVIFSDMEFDDARGNMDCGPPVN
jgi:hypothetical protein